MTIYQFYIFYNPFLNSDIVVASFRKWFPIISGGILINLSKKFEFDKIDELKENYKYFMDQEKKFTAEAVNK